MSCRVPISGQLDVKALHRAFDGTVEHYPAFRSVLLRDGGGTRVLMGLPKTCRMTHTDVRAVPSSQMKQCVDALALAHARRPFDLTAGPLLRAHLLKLSDSERVLLLCAHRIAADIVSLHGFVDAVFHRYAECERGGGADGGRDRCIHGPMVVEPRLL